MLTVAAASAVFALDAASKHLVRVLPRASYPFVPGLRIRHVRFVHAAFSQHRSRAGLVLSWLIALACTAVLILSDRAFHTAAAQIGVGAALGGGLGNLVEVMRRQAITDFLDLGWWPVFNVADAGIVVGLAVALWPMLSPMLWPMG